MKNNAIYILDRIYACGFALMAGTVAYGVIAYRAWWHIGTVLICLAVAAASWKDAEKEKADDGGYSKHDDHNPYPME